jgi:hypothetical protein
MILLLERQSAVKKNKRFSVGKKNAYGFYKISD